MAALILMLAVVMVLGNIFYRHQIDVTHAGAAVHTDQALALALSVESWARQQVSNRAQRNGRPFNDPDVDHPGETWAQAVPMLPVEGGVIRGCLQDLQAKININNFAWYGGNATALATELSPSPTAAMGTARLWHNLLELADLPVTGARSAALVDWLDDNNNLVNAWGAEQPDYEGVRRIVANRPVADASELAAVIGYELAEVQFLLPFITALPVTPVGASGGVITPTTININTASEGLLMALGGVHGEDFVMAVLDGSRSRWAFYRARRFLARTRNKASNEPRANRKALAKHAFKCSLRVFSAIFRGITRRHSYSIKEYNRPAGEQARLSDHTGA